MQTELDTHLGYPKYGCKGKTTGNSRNGQSQKTLKGEQGHVNIEVPRDRQGRFETQLVKIGQYDAAQGCAIIAFPSDEAVYKVVYLAMRHIAVACGRCQLGLEVGTQSLCYGVRGTVSGIITV